MENISQAINTFDSQHFMGKNGFVWWYGVVEDRKDPLYLGRVKVRVIGWHTDDKTEGEGIPTEDLPWADVISPINSASISGIGISPTGIMIYKFSIKDYPENIIQMKNIMVAFQTTEAVKAKL